MPNYSHVSAQCSGTDKVEVRTLEVFHHVEHVAICCTLGLGVSFTPLQRASAIDANEQFTVWAVPISVTLAGARLLLTSGGIGKTTVAEDLTGLDRIGKRFRIARIVAETGVGCETTTAASAVRIRRSRFSATVKPGPKRRERICSEHINPIRRPVADEALQIISPGSANRIAVEEVPEAGIVEPQARYGPAPSRDLRFSSPTSATATGRAHTRAWALTGAHGSAGEHGG